MIRSYLCDAVAYIKKGECLTYAQLSEYSGLTVSQIGRILKGNGNGVSVEKIEAALNMLGYQIEINILDYKDKGED